VIVHEKGDQTDGVYSGLGCRDILCWLYIDGRYQFDVKEDATF